MCKTKDNNELTF